MSLYRKIENIKTQIIDTERMLSLVGDHPIMSVGFIEKLNDLKTQLKNLSRIAFEPSVRLLFSGNAVRGSIGIKSSFVSKTIRPFQSLVKTQAALIRFGKVGEEIKSKKKPNTDLFLTALPIGSFGVELSQLDTDDLFDEQEVSNAIRQTIELIYSASESDAKFELATEKAPQKTLTNLKAFFKEVANEHSIIKMESGDLGVQISEEKVLEALERVDAAENREDEEFVIGILRGILLDSGKFEIISNEGIQFSGFIGPELEEEKIIQFNKEFLNKPCKIHLQIHRTIYRTGNEKISYELLDIVSI